MVAVRLVPIPRIPTASILPSIPLLSSLVKKAVLQPQHMSRAYVHGCLQHWLGFCGEGSGSSALATSDATAVPSKTPAGSTLHAEGRCSPCHFFSTTKGCRAGTTCNFCHMAHEILPRPRPCRQRRAKAKRLAEAMLRRPPEVGASTMIEQSLSSTSDEA